MMIRCMTAFALATALTVPVMAQGTSNMDILRQKIKADKKLVVAANLTLTEAEGAEILAGVRSVPERPSTD